MFNFIKIYLQEKKEAKLKKALDKIEYNKQHDSDIEKRRKNGTLLKNTQYPLGHPAHIASID